ncbi:hypothetical protein FIV42_00620 [Persicimonas caeni]|uniref:Uncharacterized protein n=1 Tax=Persicimonas caeni TaxID=2292766 RepID=A0A4Y6PMN3_PERCE|nr:hypothetical protein [Persicimonas caeni]QDG49287.1 hypothetical protein FIV42_00620 [Persicimonas caeni]QED30508.1 hypothetical protein FRD00_00615 [Persicimonas caeni]
MKTKDMVWLGVLGVCFLVLFGAVLASSDCSFEARPSAGDAQELCEERIKARLKAPSTAEFGTDPVIETEEDGTNVTIESWVDAQNPMGAMLRSDWTCEATYDEASGKWRLDELNLRSR